ncbi:hypothetical protein EGW08_007122 [Elysia chlorotica]|uniref:Uncharacterized protein n=1 Tax=Elysia chlorotica TaxID=188477 RepID=A0A433TU84_ELYCH|nr:hypothetical protein EGW08_007122 [Elysia chlorotica]
MAYKQRNGQRAAVNFIEWKLKKNNIVLFTKSYSPEGQECHRLLRSCTGVNDKNYDCVCYEKRTDTPEFENYLWMLSGTNNRESQHVFIRGDYLGGYWKILKLNESGKLQRIINNLALFSPGSKNYRNSNKSWNLALEADPDVLPDLVLKVRINNTYHGTIFGIIPCSANDMHHVDCEHFGAPWPRNLPPLQPIASSSTIFARPLGSDGASLTPRHSVYSISSKAHQLVRLTNRTCSVADNEGVREQRSGLESKIEVSEIANTASSDLKTPASKGTVSSKAKGKKHK